MRVALVGVGRFGRRYLETLAGLADFELAAVASRNPATDELLPAGCRRMDDWRDALDVPGLQGVLVATPPASHAAITHAAITRGLAVLVEKPLTLDVDEAQALLALPARAPVMVEHTHLFAPAFQALRERVAGARLLRIEVDAGGAGPWRADVDVLWDWGPHWVAVCLDLLGRTPNGCACRVVTARRVNGGIGQTLDVELDFGDQQIARLRLDNLLDGPRRRLGVTTADGRLLVYDELQPQPLTEQCGDGAPAEAVPVEATRPLAAALQAFSTAYSDSQAGRATHVRSDLRFGVDVVRTLAACETATTR